MMSINMKLSTRVSKRQFRQAYYWLHQNISTGEHKNWWYTTDDTVSWVRVNFLKEEDFVLFCLIWVEQDANV